MRFHERYVTMNADVLVAFDKNSKFSGRKTDGVISCPCHLPAFVFSRRRDVALEHNNKNCCGKQKFVLILLLPRAAEAPSQKSRGLSALSGVPIRTKGSLPERKEESAAFESLPTL